VLGLRAWIRLLLEGRRLFLAAGNDAHGAFNRTFQLGLPWIYIKESRHYLFGKSRTGILAGPHPDARPFSMPLRRAVISSRRAPRWRSR